MLISEEYRKLNQKLHEDHSEYGNALKQNRGKSIADVVLQYVAHFKTRDVLDYGCGKGWLAQHLPFPIKEYDPALPGKDALPEPADLVFCLDVLEHIEPEYLQAVLKDLKRCVKRYGSFIIHTGPAEKKLADGRNAHLIQQPAQWWSEQIKVHFELADVTITHQHVQVDVSPKKTERI